MEKLPPFRGITREEYRASVMLNPRHPAFAAGYEYWTRATLKEVERLCNPRRIVEKKQP